MQIIILLIGFMLSIGNAAYISTSINDSRIQNESNVSNPSGIVGLSVEYGLFNEPGSVFDFKTSTELKRLGYSHDANNETISTSLWTVGFKPIILRIAYGKVYLDAYNSIGYVFGANNINKYMESRLYRPSNGGSYTFGYGYKIGYVWDANWEFGLMADYRYVNWRFDGEDYDLDWMSFCIGGIGISIQYNLK